MDLDAVRKYQDERFLETGDHGFVLELLPKVMKPGWRVAEYGGDGFKLCGYVRKRKDTKLKLVCTVIVSGTKEEDGKRWVHLSMSMIGRVPTWDELVEVKEWILGMESKAIKVIPPRSKYVNIHPHVLHIFSCVDGDGLPDFTGGTESL